MLPGTAQGYLSFGVNALEWESRRRGDHRAFIDAEQYAEQQFVRRQFASVCQPGGGRTVRRATTDRRRQLFAK